MTPGDTPRNADAPMTGGVGMIETASPDSTLTPPEGVEPRAWARLAEREGGRWAIVERDADGCIIGCAYRDRAGAKTFQPGGKRGLILEWPLANYAGSSAAEPVYVCEGASDTAALLGLGLDAVGVPMAGACGDMLADLLADRHVCIVADADTAGRNGAERITSALLARCASVRVIEPPCGAKDAREAVIAGADADGFSTLAAEAKPLAAPPMHPESRRNRAALDTGDHGVSPALAAYTSFPVDVLPEPIRSFVADAAKAIGCDASYIALPLLSALAAAIGNTYRIALKRGWTEPAILWTAIVGESGTMKTPAFKASMRAISEAQSRAWKEHDAKRAEYETEALRYEAELTTWKRQAAKGKGDAGDPPEKPAPPIARRYIVSDTTTEALAPILLGNPRGVLLARDELAGWFGSFDRYAKAGKSGADSAHWLSMHTGEALTIDRKTGTPPTIHVPSASVCIAGGIQPGILARAMGVEHHESGMLARLLFAMPPRTAKRWTEADVDAAREAAAALVFDRLFALTPETNDDGDERPRLVTLTDDAKRAWVSFYNEHATEQAELSGDLSAAWSKLEGYAARLALVIHLTRWAADDDTLRDPALVDEASIAAGVLLARWFGAEAKRVYAILSETDDDRDARRLVELIERKGGMVTPRELQHASRAHREPGRAETALNDLARLGYGTFETDTHGGGRGRPAHRFRLSTVSTVYENHGTVGTDSISVDVDSVDGAPDAEAVR